MSKTALFTNFSTEEFIGYWDGKPRVYKAGESRYEPDYLARHLAKHLTNRELLRKGLERCTSPKHPEQVPEFMNLFNKAYLSDDSEVEDTDPESQAVLINKNKEREGVQVVEVPADDEEEFEKEPEPVEESKPSKNKK